MQSLKTPEVRRKIEKELYGIANEIVGNVEPKMDNLVTRYRNGEFAYFCLDREHTAYSEILDVWKKWIEAYCVFKKLHTPEMATIMDNPDLVVCWLKEPSVDVNGLGYTDDDIKKFPDEHWQYLPGGKRPNIENPSFVRVRAYLTIYRIDYSPIIGN